MSNPRIPNAPSPVQLLFARALDLHRAGQVVEAEQAYRAVLKTQQRHFDAAHLLGLLLLQRGDAEAAEHQLRRALKFPTFETAAANVAETNNNLGLALVQLRRFEEALASFDAALSVAPGHQEALSNRAAALHELGRLTDALSAADQAIARDSGYAVGHLNRAKILIGLGRLEDAIGGFDRALALEGALPDTLYMRGLLHLQLGNYAQGWQDCEHRWRQGEYPTLQHAAHVDLAITREGIRGKRVLVVAEQGLGDEISFASMIPDLAHDAANVTLECDPRLTGLFGRAFPGVALVARDAPVRREAFDSLIPAGSLGRLYRRAPQDFPTRESYLTPDTVIVAKWKRRLAESGKHLKVGLSWRGGSEATGGNDRSIALEQWRTIVGTPNADFISLQYGDVRGEIERMNAPVEKPILQLQSSEIGDMDELAGLVSALDLVLTVDNSLLHLSGALGAQCWMPTVSSPHWRYGLSEGRMPWYDSVRLYRQAVPGNWDDPLERIASDLAQLAAGSARGAPSSPS